MCKCVFYIRIYLRIQWREHLDLTNIYIFIKNCSNLFSISQSVFICKIKKNLNMLIFFLMNRHWNSYDAIRAHINNVQILFEVFHIINYIKTFYKFTNTNTIFFPTK